MKKKALYWHETKHGIHCTLCPNNCLLKEGQRSTCRTRIVENGILYTLAYGNPVASHVDPIEKKPLYHFKPGHHTYSIATAGCNLHCKNCQNASISQTAPIPLEQPILPEEIVQKAKHSGCESISLTYTDPVAYFEYAMAIAKEAKRNDIPVILVSAGYINPAPLMDLIPYITAANIDLKSMSEEFYHSNCKAKLSPVLAAIKTLHKSHIWLELTHLIISGLNDNEEQFTTLCDWMLGNEMNNVPLHISRFFPHYKLDGLSPTRLTTLETAQSIARNKGLKHVYLGNVNTMGASTTVCPACKASLIKRNGYHTILLDDFNGICNRCGAEIHGLW